MSERYRQYGRFFAARWDDPLVRFHLFTCIAMHFMQLAPGAVRFRLF